MLTPPAFARPEPLAIPSDGTLKSDPVVPGGKVISDIASDTQARTNWCWAAVGAALSRFLGSPMTQVDVAVRWYAPAQAGNDVQSLWAVVHKIFGVSMEKRRSDDLKKTEKSRIRIVASIDAGHPVGVNIIWDAGGGHFVCIFGYDRLAGEQAFWIYDPTGLDGNSSNCELRLVSEMARYPEPAGTPGQFGHWAEALFLPDSGA
ncbi:MAG: C39 family peptidase [Sphingopyxis sp.]|uniref:C39 family peptidase n=1 Tax=Sphingopyxis sp. TaxID=1908224 RepID=UPI002ABCC1AF|nr:C39 family peptidase [Sphingopyxis sp.]MDZ3833105.1 C39 family peptidase [Sphingopyxis sp.]